MNNNNLNEYCRHEYFEEEEKKKSTYLISTYNMYFIDWIDVLGD
jgi:hypothetical protein